MNKGYNLTTDRSKKSIEIWILNYKGKNLDTKFSKLFLRHNINYPKIGCLAKWGKGKILHYENQHFVFINSSQEINGPLFNEISKIENVRNFTSGMQILKINNEKLNDKISKAFDCNQKKNSFSECKILSIDNTNLYFFRNKDEYHFLLPRSYRKYFSKYIDNVSNDTKPNSQFSVDLENYFNSLIERNS